MKQEYDVRMLFSDNWDLLPGKIKCIFMHVRDSKSLEDSLEEEEVRPTTSYNLPKEVHRRPTTSYRKNPFVAEIKAKIKNSAMYILKIVGDLLDLGEKISQLKNLLSDSVIGARAKELLIVYEIKRVDFDMWDEGNHWMWSMYVDGLRQKFKSLKNLKRERTDSSESGEEETPQVTWNVS